MSDFFNQVITASGQTYREDDYLVPDAQRVEFYSPNRGTRVEGILSGELNFNVTSSWVNALGTLAGSTGSKILDTADRLSQAATGFTIQQPWFSRKVWAGTTPIQFTVLVRFYAWEDAETEVFQPLINLLSLVYPRLSEEFGAGDRFLGSLLSLYHIPGPSLFWPNNVVGLEGDQVEVRVGKIINYTGCYIENINVRIPNTYTEEGFPHLVEAAVLVSAIDVAYVQPDGSFTPFVNQSYNVSDDMIDLRNRAADLLETTTSGLSNFASNILQ